MHIYERRLWEKNIRLIAGIDEAGRGPLAGPVVAAVVILREELFLPELNDSKCVSERLRNKLAGEIKAKAAGWGIGIASVGFIERCNILQATLCYMRKVLDLQPDFVLVDGNLEVPGLSTPQEGSLKVTRKAHLLQQLHSGQNHKGCHHEVLRYTLPQVWFCQNKGIHVRHPAALNKYGPVSHENFPG